METSPGMAFGDVLDALADLQGTSISVGIYRVADPDDAEGRQTGPRVRLALFRGTVGELTMRVLQTDEDKQRAAEEIDDFLSELGELDPETDRSLAVPEVTQGISSAVTIPVGDEGRGVQFDLECFEMAEGLREPFLLRVAGIRRPYQALSGVGRPLAFAHDERIEWDEIMIARGDHTPPLVIDRTLNGKAS